MIENDYWVMVFTNGEETKTFEGKSPRSIEDMLLGVKRYLENKNV